MRLFAQAINSLFIPCQSARYKSFLLVIFTIKMIVPVASLAEWSLRMERKPKLASLHYGVSSDISDISRFSLLLRLAMFSSEGEIELTHNNIAFVV